MPPVPHKGALLIVNADDYGLTSGVSRAVIDAHRDGVVTSTSVLALGPGFDKTAGWLDDVPELGCGAHLAAVGEDPPLLSAREIPSLVDRSGRLPISWRRFLPLAAAGRIDADDLRREFGAQLDLISESRPNLDHIDTHQNLHLWPMVRDVVLELAAKHDVRAMRVTRSAERGLVGQVVNRLAARLEARCDSSGVAYPATTIGLDEAGHLDLATMVGALERMATSSTAELATHPGELEDPDRARYRWGYQWPTELSALCSATVRTAIGELGFRLGTFADLEPGRRGPH